MTDAQKDCSETRTAFELLRKDFGNGDIARGACWLRRISSRLRDSRRREPVFAEGKYHALGKIEERQKELSAAILKNDFAQQKAVELIVATMRFLNGEHHPEIGEE